jgi:hypothetical protein
LQKDYLSHASQRTRSPTHHSNADSRLPRSRLARSPIARPIDRTRLSFAAFPFTQDCPFQSVNHKPPMLANPRPSPSSGQKRTWGSCSCTRSLTDATALSCGLSRACSMQDISMAGLWKHIIGPADIVHEAWLTTVPKSCIHVKV